MHKFTAGSKSNQPDEGRQSLVSEEAEIPLFTSPRALQKPTKVPIEGLEAPMEEHTEHSLVYKAGENEVDVISPQDLQDDQSEDPDAELSMTESENEKAQFNDRMSTDEEFGEAGDAVTID